MDHGVHSFSWKLVLKLRSVTCHIRSTVYVFATWHK